MAKAEAIMASVTTHQHAFGDPRFVTLAETAGYANHYEALGRMEYLWSRCTALGTDKPGLKVIRVTLGKEGAVALLEADLGEVMPDGEIRVKGCEGRTEWFADSAPRGAKGGAIRAANAPRVGGRFVREHHLNDPSEPDSEAPPLGEPDDLCGPPQITSESPANTSEGHFAGDSLVPATSDHHTKYKDQDQDQSQIKNPKIVCVGESARDPGRADAHTQVAVPAAGWRGAQVPPPAILTGGEFNPPTVALPEPHAFERANRKPDGHSFAGVSRAGTQEARSGSPQRALVPTQWKPADTPENAAAIADLPAGVDVALQLKRFIELRRGKGTLVADVDAEWRGWLTLARPTGLIATSSRASPIATGPTINHEHHRNLREIAARQELKPGDATAAIATLHSLLSTPTPKANTG